MKMKIFRGAVIGVLAVGFALTLGRMVWMDGRIRAFERDHGGSVLANLSKEQMDRKIKDEIAARSPKPVVTRPRPVRETVSVRTAPARETRREPLSPFVAFAASGRYLPPGGLRAIEFESVNVSSILACIRRVAPQNVVQMLAREEGAYSRYRDNWYWDDARAPDSDDTAELAGEKTERTLRCRNVPDEREKTALTIDAADGGPTNGIYLVSCRDADGSPWSPSLYRVVCLSDLGLSVRRNGEDDLGVWVTSLSTGRPVEGAGIEIYSPANIRVMEGRTDARGWCRVTRVAKGEPFAVVARSGETDMTFLALRDSMKVDETHADGAREPFPAADDVRAFLWTERGIYRHGETIFLQAILRTGARRAPAPQPVELVLKDARGRVFTRKTLMTDAEGTVTCDAFSVPDEAPSGKWTLLAKTPGESGVTLGSRTVKVEEFVPPQIRVTVTPDAAAHPTNFSFKVAAEHLFGAAADGLRCDGSVVFEDVAFAPEGWSGWSFGDEERGLTPTVREVGERTTDGTGSCRFAAPMKGIRLPKAAVRATAQGVVFEDGGRPATMRASAVLHLYPYYIGLRLPDTLRLGDGTRPKVALACVRPDGTRLDAAKRLSLRLERIDSVYSYRRLPNGCCTWDSSRVRKEIANVPFVAAADDLTSVELPIAESGDYAVTVSDPETGVSFGKTFYASGAGDTAVRAPLANPTAVTLAPNKAYYRVGDVPRLTVKSPFAGYALLSVMRDRERYTEILALTNATSEITLRPVTVEDAPNLDVYVSVVQSVEASARHLAARAKGQATLVVRPSENEIAVNVDAEIRDAKTAEVSVRAPGATAVTVTVVDEGINLLTDEPTPNPVGRFAAACAAEHPLYDLFHRILPVVGGEGPRASGVKTGGGFGASMLGRVSPVPTRRFKPLALWSGRLSVTDGRAVTTIELPEFVGEVRVTAVAVSDRATGSASVHRKVSPKLVAQPDAPRFVAPGDTFEVTLPLRNRSGSDGPAAYEIAADGVRVAADESLFLPKDAHTNVCVKVTAPREPGEIRLAFTARGFGETHGKEILLPVRPAVAWRESAGVKRLAPGETFVPEAGRFWYREYDSPLAECASAVKWLADYPHGCLEQTSSRIFPLISAGGVLQSLHGEKDVAACVNAGVRRVESMIRSTDFVMWPDCDYRPWDSEVSLYASHFLIEADRSGYSVSSAARSAVIRFLRRFANSTNAVTSAYACHTLALAGEANRDRMLSLFRESEGLSLLDRARLARAFVLLGDRKRAEALLANAASPSSVKEAAFAVLALLELDPDDARILPLVDYLHGRRDRQRFSWGTTGENAHALLALGEYFRRHPAQPGERFVSWRKLSLPRADEVGPEAQGLTVERRILTADGRVANLENLRCGQLLNVTLSVSTDADRDLSDLVIEDLLPGAFEPILSGKVTAGAWVMRSDARDDRMLVFSKKFNLKKGDYARFAYQVRVVSAGAYTLPGVSVEGMYHPALHARTGAGRVVVRH